MGGGKANADGGTGEDRVGVVGGDKIYRRAAVRNKKIPVQQGGHQKPHKKKTFQRLWKPRGDMF